jgi:hypothetical protein
MEFIDTKLDFTSIKAFTALMKLMEQNESMSSTPKTTTEVAVSTGKARELIKVVPTVFYKLFS